MISVREYSQGKSELLLAACDSDLLGKTFKDEMRGLKLEVTKAFYEGKIVTLAEFEAHMKKATIANLIGQKTVKKAIELGLVVESSVLKIGGVPHVQIVKTLSQAP